MRRFFSARYVILTITLALVGTASTRSPHRITGQPVKLQRAVKKPGARPLPRILAVDERIARRVNALRPTVKRALEGVIARLPRRVTLLVTSARRTRAEQAALKPTFGIKARPGTSPHEDGRAIDVNVLVDGKRISPKASHRVIGVAMASEGFHYLGALDPVHYSIPKDEIDPALKKGPELEPMTMDEMLALQAADDAPAQPAVSPTPATGEGRAPAGARVPVFGNPPTPAFLTPLPAVRTPQSPQEATALAAVGARG